MNAPAHPELGFPLPARVSCRRDILLTSAAAMVVYLLSYVLLSVSGGYVQTRSGDARMSYGLSIPDVPVWQPRFGEGYPVRTPAGQSEWNCDTLGLLYRPLMAFDQRFVHRTIRFLTFDRDHVIVRSDLPRVRMHPIRTNQ